MFFKKYLSKFNLYLIIAPVVFAGIFYGVFKLAEMYRIEKYICKTDAIAKEELGIIPVSTPYYGPIDPFAQAVTETCGKWIGTNEAMPEKGVCLYDGDKEVQTYADIQVWSYSEKRWVQPAGTSDAQKPTILTPNDGTTGRYFPILIKCPWGCTLGYTK